MPLPKGFARALKHGLYGRRFSEPQKQGLRGMPPNACHQELAALRVSVDYLLKRMNQPDLTISEQVSLSNALVKTVTGIATLARLEDGGGVRTPEEMLEQALRGINPWFDEALDVEALPAASPHAPKAVQLRLPLPGEEFA